MRRGLKHIAGALIICFLNTILPVPVLAGEVGDVIQKMTTQQASAKASTLTPSERDQIRRIIGASPSVNKPQSISQAMEQASGSPESVEKPAPGKEKLEEELMPPEETLSTIEQMFADMLSSSEAEIGKHPSTLEVVVPLRQFGYDIFSQTVGKQFPLVPSLPIGPDYHINAGDRLMITIWGNVSDSFSLDVDERGAVLIPKVGVVSLAGLTITEARETLYSRLAAVFVTDFNLDLAVKEIGSAKIYLLGNFNSPGAYTILANTSLYDAIFLGGGPTRGGSLRKIKLVQSGGRERTVDLYDFLLKGRKTDDILLRGGDVVRVPAIGPVAAISGNIGQPGIYELLSPAKTELADFISMAGEVTPTSYLQRIQIERRGSEVSGTVVDVKYADYMKIRKVKPIYVRDQDFITVFSVEQKVKNAVYLSGNVARPGRYELRSGMRLSDLIGEADGLLPKTYMQRAQIFRLEPPDMTPRIIVVSLNEMKKGETNDPFLQEFDRIRIYSEAELGEGNPMVYASGELKDGDISCPLADNMRVSDLVFQAGGLKEGADIERAELARIAAPGKVEFYNLNLRKILKEGDQTEDLLLQRDDYLFVRTTPSYGSTETVSITGNVRFPGKYALYPGEKLSSLIARAGSYTNKAFLDGAVFIRPALIKQQEGNFDKLQAELTRRKNWELAQQPVNLPSGEADFRKRQIDDLYSVSADKLALETSGRVIIDLYNVRPGSTQDILLQNGDSLYIPDQQIGVTVIGEVAFPGTLIYERGKRAWDYVNGCGGGTAFADENKVLIVRANGRVDKGSRSSAVGPGDTIFVQSAPLQMVRYQEPFSWGVFWDNAMKATTTMVQVLTSVVTVYLLYKSAK